MYSYTERRIPQQLSTFNQITVTEGGNMSEYGMFACVLVRPCYFPKMKRLVLTRSTFSHGEFRSSGAVDWSTSENLFVCMNTFHSQTTAACVCGCASLCSGGILAELGWRQDSSGTYLREKKSFNPWQIMNKYWMNEPIKKMKTERKINICLCLELLPIHLRIVYF